MSGVIRIGLFGLGNVGGGVVEQLIENQSIIEKRVGAPIKITKAVVANLAKRRHIDLSGIELSDEPEHILDDPTIDVVVELIGGIDPAESIIMTALERGKSVVTANKALLAQKSATIFPYVYEQSTCFGYETSVGGGIPIIRTLREGFAGEQMEEIVGIMNGTANYILSRMTSANLSFDVALKEAQEKGYAEADPTFDIEGIDTAHKLVILMNLGFNGLFDLEDIHIEGITQITSTDVEYAGELGYKIKLLGEARKTEQGIEGHVHPSLVRNQNMLASVNGAYNAISLVGNYAGPSLLYGLGAGPHPSASAVVADIVEVCRFRVNGQQRPIAPLSIEKKHLQSIEIMPIGNIRSQYYLRFNVYDQPGVLAQISTVLGEYDISIYSMIQKGVQHDPDAPVAVIIITHEAMEKNVQYALKIIDGLDIVIEKTQLIRIDSR